MQQLPTTLSRFFLHFMRPYRWAFVLMFIMPFGWALELNVFPYLTKIIIDIITTYEGDRAHIYQLLAAPLWIGFWFWLALILCWRGMDVLEYYLEPRFQAAVRMAMFDYVLQHSHKYFSDNFAGSLANKISDMTRGSWLILNLLFRHFNAVFMAVLVSLALLWTVHPLFTLIVTLFFLGHMGICLALSKRSDTLSNIHSESRTLLNGKIVDALTSILNVRLFSHSQFENTYLDTYQQQEIKHHKRVLLYMTKVRALLEIPSFLMIAAMIGGLVYGWQQGWISAGDFAYVIALSFSLMMSVWRLGWELPNLFREIGVCKQALSIITHPHDIVDTPEAIPLQIRRGEIAFDNVTFHYTPQHNIFRDKNILIPSGQKVGLVGFSGSGKSTFVNLILRFYDLESGRILIDGQDIRHVTQDSLRAQIAMIPQDTALFHRTLRENIRYGRLDATEAEIMEASKKAHCDEFIAKLPEGYDSLVGERGVKLSGGQRQRIAIARAILKNAPIIILDEATSSLDSMTEIYIQESLRHLMQGRTTIVIAHRLSTLRDMDRILVFHQGQIVEDGTHDMLVNGNGHYAKLWAMQAGGFLPDEPTPL